MIHTLNYSALIFIISFNDVISENVNFNEHTLYIFMNYIDMILRKILYEPLDITFNNCDCGEKYFSNKWELIKISKTRPNDFMVNVFDVVQDTRIDDFLRLRHKSEILF